MFDKLKVLRDIEKYGLDHEASICPDTLHTTTITSCNGVVISEVVLDVSDMFEAFRDKMLEELHSKYTLRKKR